MNSKKILKTSNSLGVYTLKRNNKLLIIEPQEPSWVILDNNSFREIRRSRMFKDLLRKNPEALRDVYSRLYKKNIEVKFNPNPVSWQKLIKDKFYLSSKLPHHFVLEVSNKCNLECKYCAGNHSRRGLNMDWEIIKITIDKILSLSDKPIRLVFHGGEPLLNFSVIKKGVRYIRTKDKNKRVKLTIQTNATLLTQEMINFFKKYNVNIGISLDGPKEIHDKNRVYPNGKGSFNDVMKAINLLKRNKCQFGTIMIVSNPKDIRKFYPFLKLNKINYIKLNPYYQQGRGKDNIMPFKAQREFAKEHLRLFRKVLDHNKKYPFKIILENISIMLHNLLSRERIGMCMRAPCGAGNSTLGITAAGDIYPCDRMKYEKKFLIGNIRENKNLEGIISHSPIREEIYSRTPLNIPKCRSCVLRNFCGSGCATCVYIHFGSFFRESDFCEYNKDLYLGLMWLFFERKKEIISYLYKYKDVRQKTS